MKIALIYNENGTGTFQMMQALAGYIRTQGHEVYEMNQVPGVSIGELSACDFDGCDAGIAVGGDGTLLASTRKLSMLDIPLFGMNMGRVGFLSSVEKDHIFDAVDRLLNGEYTIQNRLLLKAQQWRDNEMIYQCYAFNDIVLVSGVNARAINFDLAIDQELINSYNADGIIISTPTGSTGYALSAGGPIVLEELDITLITPICPHTFFSRPIVAGAGSTVRVTNRSELTSTSLTADGQVRCMIRYQDEVTVTRSEKHARIIHFAGDSYFERIKKKLYV